MIPVGVALAVLVVGVLATARTRVRAARPPARPAQPIDYHATTLAYARAKLGPLTVRGWTGALADELHDAWIRTVRQILPGVPYAAWIALGASQEGQRDVVDRSPYPTGWWGVERATIQAELREAIRADARRMSRTEGDAPGFDHATLDGARTLTEWIDSPAAQSATAARMFRTRLTLVDRALRRTWDVSPFDFDAWGTWEYQAAACAYSSGVARCVELLEIARRQLQRTGNWQRFLEAPRSDRWTGVAQAVWSVPEGRVQRFAWALIRPRERLECARLLIYRIRPGDVQGGIWIEGDSTWPETFDREVSAVAFGGEPVR
jgi:hypothetical protein